MQPDQIKLEDWKRILIGDVPSSFFLELVIRSIIIFLLLLFSMRLMGKRMSGLLSRNELVAMVSLAAAVGIPLTAPDRGILPAFIIALVVVFIQRWISARAMSNSDFEQFALGKMDVLVKDGVIDLKRMEKVRVSRERLVAQLRSQGVKQLGTVKRLFMEANGSFTLIRTENSTPGLTLLPHWDKEFNDRLKHHQELTTCENCGLTIKTEEKPEKCPHCGSHDWTTAVE
ncbi:DUF421 domain-containing protein [Mucilaginibacter terrenus]|uniref:DUF421 domain-containing protein n=1 Tax=Mucilaginibacter terrenus TaxID=2482727 RepID=A0A3E2NTR2_9SPHI|nr:YetF domain-containing protein [Mucilaginibacter terrenus]RFZ84405.1 DUF421 domain-containing protein [Mucilaginibacter terrenus]